MKTLITTLIATAMLAFSASASAVTIVLNQSNEIGHGTWGTVDILANGDDIDFVVTIIDGSFDTIGANNFGMDKFSFNYDLTDADAAGIVLTNFNPGDWDVTNALGSGGWGKFDINLADPGSRTSSLTFSVTGVTGDTVDDYFIEAVAHVGGFNVDGGDASAFIYGENTDRGGPPQVPIPAAAWLFGSGLIGLVGIARRKVTDNNA